jgi:hypothetical protein
MYQSTSKRSIAMNSVYEQPVISRQFAEALCSMGIVNTLSYMNMDSDIESLCEIRSSV